MGLTLALVTVAMTALAQQTTSPMALRDDLPIDVSAERCEVLEDQDMVQCSGNVRVSQGEAILTGNQMTIRGLSEEGGFSRIEARGRVRYANGTDALSGEVAIYDAPTSTVQISGNVVAIQDDQIMTGGELTYNTETGRAVFSGGASGRVRGLFHTAKSGR